MNIHSVPAASSSLSTKADAVLDAALALFTERTYGGTAMPAVAERAGVAVGTIYRSFPSKEALANAVFARGKQQLLEAVTAEVTGGGPARDEVLAMWRGLAGFARANPDAFAFLEHQQHAGYLDAGSREVSARVERAACGVVERGQSRGEIRPDDPGLLVAMVFGAFVGLSKACRATETVLSPAVIQASGKAAWDLLRAAD